MTRHFNFFLAMLLAAAGAVFAAASLPLDPGRSSVTASFKQMGVKVDADFTEFSGRISFDPGRPAEAEARIEIHTDSLELGDEEYNAEVRKPEWFDSRQYPVAGFESREAQALGEGRFKARGMLTFKGKSKELVIDFTAVAKADGTVYQGGFPLSRAEFGIGDASWNDVLDDRVDIRFSVFVPHASKG